MFFRGQLARLFGPAGQLKFFIDGVFLPAIKNETGQGARQGLAKDAARLETGSLWRDGCSFLQPA
jgi:hypothetical protein